MRLLWLIVGTALVVCCSASAPALASDRPFEIAAEEYYQKLLERKYDELERAAVKARQNEETISDGQPRLATIYGGLAGCLAAGCRNRLSETEWQKRLSLLAEWRKKNSKSVTAELAYARFFVAHAYFIRGQGYAGTVDPKAWKPFTKSMETAYGLLQKASPAAKRDPGWSEAMLDVGLALGWPSDQVEKIYIEAIERTPTYLPLYFSASAYLAPRWYGSQSALRQFIEDAVIATREKLGETMYARLNWSLRTETMFVDGQADWTRMKAGFDRIVVDFPDPWNINFYARFACLAGDGATFKRLAEQIGNAPLNEVWQGENQYVSMYRGCKDRESYLEQQRAMLEQRNNVPRPPLSITRLSSLAFLPTRKAGLWEIATLKDTLNPSATGPYQQCIDADTDRKAQTLLASASTLKCESTKLAREAGAIVIHTVCQVGKHTVTTDSVTTGNFDSEFQTEITGQYEPPIESTSTPTQTTRWRWLGPCKPDQKPGQFIFPKI